MIRPISRAGAWCYNPAKLPHSFPSHPQGSFTMRFTKQFFGGILVGLALGTFIGAALVEGKKDVNYTTLAGVGSLLVVTGVAIGQARAPKH
jgi:hypothetical protein